MNSEIDEMRAQINRVLDCMPTEVAQQRTRAHLEWELKEMLRRIHARDLSTSEILALIAILHPAHARVLSPVVGNKPTLRIVASDLKPPQLRQTAD
jgi:hypothetical protein